MWYMIGGEKNKTMESSEEFVKSTKQKIELSKELLKFETNLENKKQLEADIEELEAEINKYGKINQEN